MKELINHYHMKFIITGVFKPNFLLFNNKVIVYK